MAKKTSINISAVTVIRLIIFLLIGLIAFNAYARTVEFLTTSPMFAVKDVLIDASIQFIDTQELRQLQGRNMFKISLKRLEKQIAFQYPQIAQLRIVREWPDRIKVLAKKRDTLGQIALKGKYLLVDTEGVALYYVPQALGLPQIKGIMMSRSNIVLGALLKGKEIEIAAQVLNTFRLSPVLGKIIVNSIDVGNLSKIDVTIAATVHVLVDQDDLSGKLRVLEMLLSQNKIDFHKVQYIDVRFKEPVIAEQVTTLKDR